MKTVLHGRSGDLLAGNGDMSGVLVTPFPQNVYIPTNINEERDKITTVLSLIR